MLLIQAGEKSNPDGYREKQITINKILMQFINELGKFAC
jgi:hypothetical protein